MAAATAQLWGTELGAPAAATRDFTQRAAMPCQIQQEHSVAGATECNSSSAPDSKTGLHSRAAWCLRWQSPSSSHKPAKWMCRSSANCERCGMRSSAAASVASQ